MQLAFLLGLGALLLVGLGVGAYAVHKWFRRLRSEEEAKSTRWREDDAAAFATATLQAVIAGLKAQEKQLREWWEAAENRAEEATRLNEVLVRELPCGLLVFDREGFIKLANPAARAILGIDIWARQRYPEVLGEESQLSSCVRRCLETGESTTRDQVACVSPRGEIRSVQLRIAPYLGRSGQVSGAVCLITELKAVHQPIQ